MVSFSGSFPIGLNVEWKQANQTVLTDPYLKNWLLDTGSLTERIQSLCHQFSLVLLGQSSTELHDNEKHLLLSNNNATHEVREVLLCGNNTPWVFARSVIPQSLINDELANLGDEPLGKRLFNDSRFCRSNFELCCLSAQMFGYETNQQLWGRRSVFSLGLDRMIVAEVFLPQAPVYYSRYDYGIEPERS